MDDQWVQDESEVSLVGMIVFVILAVAATIIGLVAAAFEVVVRPFRRERHR